MLAPFAHVSGIDALDRTEGGAMRLAHEGVAALNATERNARLFPASSEWLACRANEMPIEGVTDGFPAHPGRLGDLRRILAGLTHLAHRGIARYRHWSAVPRQRHAWRSDPGRWLRCMGHDLAYLLQRNLANVVPFKMQGLVVDVLCGFDAIDTGVDKAVGSAD